MSIPDILARFPRQVRFSLERPGLFYVLRPGWALRRSPEEAAPPGAAFSLEEGTIVAYLDPPGPEVSWPDWRVSPVYALGQDGPPAVPTGLILLRFQEQVRAESRQADLARLGYALVETLSYAPQAAWVRSQTGDMARSLRGAPDLERLSGIENIEPQMLQERRPR